MVSIALPYFKEHYYKFYPVIVTVQSLFIQYLMGPGELVLF